MPPEPLTPIDPAKMEMVAGSEAGTFNSTAGGSVRGVRSARSVSSSFSVAASTAASFDEATACLAAEGIMRGLALPLLLVLADEKRENSQALRKQLRLDAIEARVAQVLAAGELQRRTDAKQDQKWVIDKWVVIALGAGGWLVALSYHTKRPNS